jgi:hypothetical protein
LHEVRLKGFGTLRFDLRIEAWFLKSDYAMQEHQGAKEFTANSRSNAVVERFLFRQEINKLLARRRRSAVKANFCLLFFR